MDIFAFWFLLVICVGFFFLFHGDQPALNVFQGHISMLNSGWFSPKTKGEFCTCSDDRTLRIWSVEKKDKHKACIKTKSQNGRTTAPSTCAYSKDGKFIAAGCRDGSILMWDTTKSNFVNPAKTIRNAHANETDISSICFSYDSRVLCSRGLDDTLKLWDLQMLKKPLFEAKGLDTIAVHGDAVFSPNDKIVVTGTSVKKGEGRQGKNCGQKRRFFWGVLHIRHVCSWSVF